MARIFRMDVQALTVDAAQGLEPSCTVADLWERVRQAHNCTVFLTAAARLPYAALSMPAAGDLVLYYHPEIDTGERERILLYLLGLLVTGRITPRDVVTIHRERHARWRHGSSACGSALTSLTV